MKAQTSPEAEAAGETTLSSPAPEEVSPSSSSEATHPSPAPAEETSSTATTPAPVILAESIVPEVSGASDATHDAATAESAAPETPLADGSHPPA